MKRLLFSRYCTQILALFLLLTMGLTFAAHAGTVEQKHRRHKTISRDEPATRTKKKKKSKRKSEVRTRARRKSSRESRRTSSTSKNQRVPVKVDTAAGPAALKQNLNSVKAQIQQTRKDIRQAKKKESRIADQIAEVELRLDKTEKAMNRARGRLSYVQKQQELLVNKIAETEQRLADRKNQLARRIRSDYMRGRQGYYAILFGSRTYQDYLARNYYVRRIVDGDVQLLAGIRVDKEMLSADRKRRDAQASELVALVSELAQSEREFKADKERKSTLLVTIRDQREAQEEALEAMLAASRQMEERIRQLQMTPAGRARLAKPFQGRFIAPVPGHVTSPFGMRYHPILHRTKLHTGVDLSASRGTPIKAAADGLVIVSGYQYGYGNSVVIDHGGGVSTLYGHCSQLAVNEGQSVKTGQVIGFVGSTGFATGPHLHFEVRHNGTPVNPR